MPDDFTFPVEAGHVMLFARAVGDENPVYRDPEHAASTEVAGLIAPPTFVQASYHWDPDASYPRPGRSWRGSAAGPTGLPQKGNDGETSGSERGLHAEQRYTYHRPLTVGETLTVRRRPGETWRKQGRRGGSLTFSEQISEFYDQAGELVVTATSVNVITGRAVDP